MVPREREKPVDNVVDDQDIRIRAAAPSDLAELHSLDSRVFGTLAYPFFVLRQLIDTLHDCWQVAVHPNGLLGYSLGVPTMDRSAGWLLGLGVLPEYRRRGYGVRLTRASLDSMNALGVGTVRLTVDPGNFGAFDLYRKLGFAAEELVREYLGPGEHRLLMSRTL